MPWVGATLAAPAEGGDGGGTGHAVAGQPVRFWNAITAWLVPES